MTSSRGRNIMTGPFWEWYMAVGLGVIVWFLAISLLGLFVHLAFPEFRDDRSVLHYLRGIAMWGIAIGLGAGTTMHFRPGRREKKREAR